MSTEVKICPKCGKHNLDISWLCAECGTSLTDVAVTQATEGITVKRQPEVTEEMPLETITVYEVKGFRKRFPWVLNLYSTHAEFITQESNNRFNVARDKARSEIKFAQTGIFMTEGSVANVHKTAFDFGANKSRLESWYPPKTADDMRKDLQGWGIGMIVVGVISILLSSILDPIWGVVLIVLGILNLLIRNRSMFIVNGLALVAVGIINIMSICSALSSTYGGYSPASRWWVMFGIMQLVWGFQEIRKYSKYASVQ